MAEDEGQDEEKCLVFLVFLSVGVIDNGTVSSSQSIFSSVPRIVFVMSPIHIWITPASGFAGG